MGQAEITAIVYTTFHAVRVFEEMRQRLPDKKSHKTDVSWLFDTWRRGWDSNNSVAVKPSKFYVFKHKI